MTKNLYEAQQLIEEMIARQNAKLLASAKRIVPSVTADDLLQPNDFPALENHAEFRYEEGLLSGMQTVQMALIAYVKDIKCPRP